MKAASRRRRPDSADQLSGVIPPQRGHDPEQGYSEVVPPDRREPRSLGWWFRSFGLLLVAVLAIVGAVLLVARQPAVQSQQAPGLPTPTSTPAQQTVPGGGGTFMYADPPPEAPPGGTYVQATIRPDGTVGVREWIDSSQVLDRLTLVAHQPVDANGLSARNVRIAADLFTVTDGATVARARTFTLHAPAFRVHLVYDLVGAVVPTTRHRAVVWPTALEVRHAGRGASTRVDLGGVQVLSMRCGPGPGQRTRPCGDPMLGGWTVRTNDTWMKARIRFP